MATSGSYSFNPDLVDIITDAYQRCGVEPSKQTAFMIQSALFSVNMVLSELSNQQLNLWTVEPVVLTLLDSSPAYPLPSGTIDILEAVLRSFTRPLDGTPASSAGGTASYAFDSNPATSCIQTSANGNISYDWGNGITNLIDMIGFQSNVARTYTLTYEGSNDGVNWTATLVKSAETYTAGELKWSLIPFPITFRYYRVRETGGATLNAQELYFVNSSQPDRLLGRVSRSDYTAIANKNNPSVPSCFTINRTTPTPTITIWPSPQVGGIYALFMNRIRQPQDATSATQTVDIPYRFLEAFTALLAAKLAVKYAIDRLEKLVLLAEKSIKMAQEEDRERVSLFVVPDAGGYCL